MLNMELLKATIGIVCVGIIMSNPTTVKVDVALWLSWGCDNEDIGVLVCS